MVKNGLFQKYSQPEKHLGEKQSGPANKYGTASDAQTSQQKSQSKVPHKTIEQLIIHNSDTQVKPIIGNKEIEKVQDFTFNA